MKIIKTFVALLLLCVTVLTSSAQDKERFTGALLWKVSGNRLTEPSYILGTHHLVNISFTDSIAGFKYAMDNTRQVVGELDMSDMQDMQEKMVQTAMMPEGESYTTLLSPEDYIRLDKSLKAFFGTGLDQMSILKPGMISVMYAMVLHTKYNPSFNPQTHEAIDRYVQRIARTNEKPVLGLETVDDQIESLFSADPLKTQAESLICQMEYELEHGKESMEQLDIFHKLYHAGQIWELYDFSFNNPKEPCPMSQAMKTSILKKRNDEWLKKLPGIMKDKSSLIAVGALHLVGEEGLLYQLSQMGYTIEAVKQ